MWRHSFIKIVLFVATRNVRSFARVSFQNYLNRRKRPVNHLVVRKPYSENFSPLSMLIFLPAPSPSLSLSLVLFSNRCLQMRKRKADIECLRQACTIDRIYSIRDPISGQTSILLLFFLFLSISKIKRPFLKTEENFHENWFVLFFLNYQLTQMIALKSSMKRINSFLQCSIYLHCLAKLWCLYKIFRDRFVFQFALECA